MRRTARLAVLGAAAVAALYLGLAAISPVALGYFGEDAVYATTAKALAEDWKLARSSEQACFSREVTIDWAELRDVERFLRENTQPEHVIASSHPERIFLTTGRRGHHFWPDYDPVAFECDPERAASLFTIPPVPGEARARSQDVERNFAIYRVRIPGAGASRISTSELSGSITTRGAGESRSERPSALRPVRTSKR